MKRLLSLGVGLSLCLCTILPVRAYEPLTHQEIGDTAVVRSNLDQILKDRYALTQGINSAVNGNSVRTWVRIGARLEDDPAFRAVNHFHNALQPWSQAGGISGQSSIYWQQNPNQGSGGSWSWPVARQRFFESLTRPSKSDRETALADTARALGQIMHTIQDATSPPHTRNDPHPIHDGYEARTEELRLINPSRFNQFLSAPPIFPSSSIFTPTGDTTAPVSIARLIDSDTYGGTLGSYTTGDQIGAAEYTNGGYVSDDTIFLDFPLPRVTSLGPGFCDPPSDPPAPPPCPAASRQYFPKVGDGDSVGHFVAEGSFFERLRFWGQAGGGYILEDRVYDDYAALLLPRAVGYSAALLDYFFRGRLKGVLQRVNGFIVNLNIGEFIPLYVFTPPYTVELKLTNESEQEAMEGNFRLYADKPDDTRSLLADLGQQTLAAGETRTFSFPVAEGFGEVKQVFVVFQGRLGHEDGAVTGSIVGPEFAEEWDKGLNGNHPWGAGVFKDPRMPNPHPDDDKQIIKVENGKLVMELVREIPTNGMRDNIVHIGPFVDKDGNLIWEPQDQLPMPITSRTLIKLKYDINDEQAPCSEGFTCHLQFIEFGFSGQRYIQFTRPGQAANIHGFFEPDSRVLVSVPVNPGTPLTVNIYEWLTQNNIPVDNLVLERIDVKQRLLSNASDLAPRRFHMEVDYVRVTDLDTEPSTSDGVVVDRNHPPVGAPPRVTLTSPVGGEVFEGETITLSADATDDDGRVVSVEFQVNGVSQFVDTSAPYETQYVVPVGLSSSTFTVKAIDDTNNFTSATYLFDVIRPPDIVITSPVEGATIMEGDLIILGANPTANFAAVSVEFAVNGVSQFVDTSAPFETQFEVPLGVTSLEITAKATDNLGRTTTATRTIGVQPDPLPTVVITSPVAGSTVVEGQTVTLRATAQDNTAVVLVQFSVNGTTLNAIPIPFTGVFTAPYTVPAGVSQLTILAGAMDSKGKVGTATPVVVNVIPDGPPRVVITSPAAGTTVLEGSLLTLTAEVTSGIQVTQVVWSLNGIAQAPVFSPPYQQVVAVPAGVTSLTIQATATDNLARTGSATTTVTVQPDPPPTVAITSPVAGSTVIEGSRPTLTAEATDNVRVDQVVWRVNGIAQPPVFSPPYQRVVTVPTGATSLTIQATAADNLGQTGIAMRTITVEADRGTTVVGRVLGTDGQPFAGANITVFGRFASRSQGNGAFNIPGVPTVRGSISAVAAALVGSTTLQGVSATIPPVNGGITNVGDITVSVTELYPGRKLLVGNGPYSVAVADLNGDGRLDLVTANSESNDVSALLGNGDGTFQPQRRFPVGSFPVSVAVVDLNGDGFPDIVTSNGGSANVSVLLGNGDGTFRAQQSFAVGEFPYSVAVADVNGDGFSDIVTANNGTNDVSILLGNGTGTFQPEQPFATGVGPGSVAIADLNGDGFPDLVTNTDSHNITVLAGNGDGTFQAPQSFDAGDFPYSVAVADLNGDGFADIATANGNSDDVSVLLGNGDGTFNAPQRFAVGRFPQSVAAADVNGDGIRDLVITNGFSYDASVLLGNGDGTFQAEQVFAVGSFPVSVKIADLNGDGKPDIVTANVFSDDVSILLGNDDGTFRDRPPPYHVYVQGTTSVSAGDVNGDLIPDVVTADGFVDRVSVLIGIGDGTFLVPRSYDVGSYPLSVTVADLNGDGLSDLVTANYGSNDVSVLVSNGEEDGGASFQPQQRFAVGEFPYSVAVADLNRDGVADIVTANGGSNDVSVLLGNGDGMFQAQQRFTAGDFPGSVAVADLNGDGFPDLVTANIYSNDVSVLLGNGDGTFQVEQRFATADFPGSVAIADLNRDGFPDIVTANESNDVSVLLGNGNGTFQVQRRFAAGDLPYQVAVADVNGDGIPDILTANVDSDDVSVLLGNGDGMFQGARVFAAGSEPISLTVADLNGDGRLDIVVGNFADTDIARWGVSVLLHK